MAVTIRHEVIYTYRRLDFGGSDGQMVESAGQQCHDAEREGYRLGAIGFDAASGELNVMLCKADQSPNGSPSAHRNGTGTLW